MFAKNTPTDLTKVTTKKQKRTYVSYKKTPAGQWQTDQFVIKTNVIKGKETKYEITGFIGNPYKLGLCKVVNNEIECDNKVIVLQDQKGELFLVPHKEGRVITPTHTWGKINLTTVSNYMFVKENNINYKINNEYLFDIDTEKTSFIATGTNIEGLEFEGYKLTYKESLYTEENKEDKVDENFYDDDIEDEYTEMYDDLI